MSIIANDHGVNGEASAQNPDLTPAQKLQEKHNADAAHHPTVEDVPDEEDLAHPPPSMQTAHAPSPIQQPGLATEPMSAKAAGKQKANEDADSVRKVEKPPAQSTLNMKSEEAFPALGAGPKIKAPTATASAWGAQRPVSVGNAFSNGANGRGPLSSSTTSSRASTPATSGMLTPVSTNATARPQSRGMPQNLSLPGKHSEKIEFAPSELRSKASGLKKPIKDIVQGINKRSKATVTMRPGPDNGLIFESTGPFEATRQALRDLAKEIGSKQKTTIDVPMSVRPFIIGKQGTVIKGISDRTGAYIQIPRAEDTPIPDLEDDDSMTTVIIEGDPVAAYMARQEVEAIVNERTSTINIRMRDVPPELYPYLSGPRNAGVDALENGREVKVHIPNYQSWSHHAPPQAPSSGLPAQFIAHPESHIKISGDRHAAQQVRAEIQRQVDALRLQITLEHIAIDRGRHQFILANGPQSMHELLEETGCAVILPPESDNTEMLVVTGPHDRIHLGVEKVMDLASSMQMSSVDVARQHANAPSGSRAHGKALVRYLQQREAIRQLERQYDARIIPNDGSIEVFSRDGKNALRARSDILNLVNAYPPSRIRHVDVDPFFHQHIRRMGAQRVRDDFGVHLLVPEDEAEQPNIVLIYEGPTDETAGQAFSRQKPTPAEIVNFEKGLQQAQEHLLGLLQGQQQIDSRHFEVPPRFHDKVRKYVEREQQKTSSAIPAQLIFGTPTSPNSHGVNGTLTASRAPSAVAALDHGARLRGPCDTIDDLLAQITSFVEAEKRDELERGHVTTFDFPQKYANYLIGKRGENINKYREEFDVDIQVNDGKVDIKGPKAKAEIAKSRIQALAKKLEDEVTHTLKIKPQYHREMIGARGNQVNRLQDRYNVRVMFPRTNSVTNDNYSTADGSSDVGVRSSRPNQAPDEVIIRGPRRGADEARDELLNLLQYTIDNSYTAAVSVAQSQLPSLIGQGGREMEKIRLETGAQIDVPGARDTGGAASRVQLQVKGTKKQVDDAKKLLEQRVKVFDESVSRTIDVAKKYHKALIGSGGSNIRNIVIAAGGSDDRRELARMVRFPRQDSDETTIRVEGNKTVAEKIIASIESFVSERENQSNETVEVAPEKHRLLIGRGGETRRSLESQFKVSIDIPRVTEQGPGRSQVKLAGQASDVAKAKARILELVKGEEGETIQVPRRAYHAISDNGRFFRRLHNDYNVKVDHAGQQPPSKTAPQRRSKPNGAALPLITDDHETTATPIWDVIEDTEENIEEGDMPWVLRGSPDSVEKARAALQKAMEQAQTRTHEKISTGYLTLPDPRNYRFVIGSGGSQINSIRKQTGCRINVPKAQAKGEPIEIIGSSEGVEQAKDIILEVIENGGN